MIKTRTQRLGLFGAVTAIALVVATPGAAFAGTSYPISGSLPKDGTNIYYSTGRVHSSGAIKINIKSWTGCGGYVYFHLRKGSSAGAARATETVVIKQPNHVYTFKKKGSTSTTIPSGRYYITAAATGAGCPQHPQIAFNGSINM